MRCSKNVPMAASDRLAEGIDDIETHVCLAATASGQSDANTHGIHWDSVVQKSCNRRGEGSFALVLPSTKKGERSWAHEISFIKPFGEIILSMQDVLRQLFAPFPSALLSCEASEVGSCSLVPLWAITALLKSLTEADRNAVLADLTLVNQLTFTSNSQLYLASCWHRWKQSMWSLVIL